MTTTTTHLRFQPLHHAAEPRRLHPGAALCLLQLPNEGGRGREGHVTTTTTAAAAAAAAAAAGVGGGRRRQELVPGDVMSVVGSGAMSLTMPQPPQMCAPCRRG